MLKVLLQLLGATPSGWVEFFVYDPGWDRGMCV